MSGGGDLYGGEDKSVKIEINVLNITFFQLLCNLLLFTFLRTFQIIVHCVIMLRLIKYQILVNITA
jgi:hypothetical protein